ncbi:MAG: hypothetical protein R3222_10445, partial [Balneolaceae bacterium]|nr:hypothetical protein [Balneolaceae bacterium]
MEPEEKDPVIPTTFIESLESQGFTDFLRKINNKKSSLLSITLPIAGIDPLAALELNPDYQEKFYWAHPRQSISIAAAGNMRTLQATGTNRFSEIADQTRRVKDEIQAYTAIEHSMAGPLFLGGYSFADHNVGQVWKKFGGARFVLPEWMLVEIGNLHLLTLSFETEKRSADRIYQDIISRITDFLNLAGKLKHTQVRQ